LGIYLDNFTSNYPIHHNVCWGIDGDAILLNKPSLYNVVAHNTLIGFSGYWGQWKTDWMYGCIYASNLMTEHIQLHPQLTLTANVLEVGALGIPASGKGRTWRIHGSGGRFVDFGVKKSLSWATGVGEMHTRRPGRHFQIEVRPAGRIKASASPPLDTQS